MPRQELLTYSDLVAHAVDYLGGDATAGALKDARRASLAAVRELAAEADWSYYYGRHRVQLVRPYSEGTVFYLHTGGVVERQLTLSGGTWPSWAALGSVVFQNCTYDVASVVSPFVAQLTHNANPGADVPACAYRLYRESYDLPGEFLSAGEVILQNRSAVLLPEHPSTWLARQRVHPGPGTPRFYHVKADPNYLASLAITFSPCPDDNYTVDLLYKRRPRLPQVDEYRQGAVSVVAGQATLQGSGTGWSRKLEGCVIRLSADRVNYPTGAVGLYPALAERVVLAVASPTAMTLDDLVEDNLQNVKYLISDLVDIEPGVMLSPLLRGVEAQIARYRRMELRAQAEADYYGALRRAREGDSRSFAEERVGGRRPFPSRAADMPLGPDSV
jgi:hypothetical protein